MPTSRWGGVWDPFSVSPAPAPYQWPSVTVNTTVINNPAPVTPTVDPKIEANTLYGKAMALCVLGFARVGSASAPIVGPYRNSGLVDFVVSFGVPDNPSGDRKIYAIYLDNEKAWEAPAGGTTHLEGTFLTEPFAFTFLPGTLTQAPVSLEAERFPTDQNAYRPQMLLEIRNLPEQRFIDKTGKPVPYVACDIGDVTDGADPQDGLNLGEALERLAYSPWAGYTSSTFEAIGLTDVVPGILIKENFTVIQVCQQVTRDYRNIDLLQSDKLRVKDRGSNVIPDFVFDRDSIIAGDTPIMVSRAGATSQRRERELISVDPDQDYTGVPSLSKIPRDPFVISAAVGKETGTTPLIMDASTRQALVTYAHYYEENARKTVTFKVRAVGYQAEPGDLVAVVDIADGFDNEVWKVRQTTHGANWVVDIEAEAVLRCSIYAPSFDPDFGSVVLLLHCNGTAGSTTFLDSSQYFNTVTAFGNAQITATSKFGTGALICDGTGDSIASTVSELGIAGTPLSATNTSPYTIECWAYFNAINRVQILVAIDTGALGRFFRLWQDGDDELKFRWEDTGGVWDPANELITTTANIATGAWYHIAADKDSTGKVRLYVNGVMLASDTPVNSAIGPTGDPVSAGASFIGFIEEVRISRMISRYGDVHGDSSFTPPTEAFPDS